MPYAVLGVVVIAGVISYMRPDPIEPSSVSASTEQVTYAEVQKIFEARCYSCHGAQVQMKNLRFDSPAEVQKNAANMYQQSVVLAQMPMNNATGITPEERQTIKRWYESGAPTTP